MPARPIVTPELYDGLLIAYREAPGNAAFAAREAGCSRDVAKKAWEKGWPRIEYAKPIREVLRSEINAAKAERLKLRQAEDKRQEDARAKAHEDSIYTLREEAVASQAARRNALGISSNLSKLIAGLAPLTDRLIASLKDDKMSEKTAMRLISDITFAVRQGNEAIRIALDIERRRLGEPTQILGLAHSEELTTDEAVAELMSLQRTLVRAQEPATRYGAHRTLPNGSTVIDLPEDAFEGDEAQIISFPRKTTG